MQKVKTFWHVFTQSLLPQPRYYRKIVRSNFSFSLKYFISLIFIFNVIFFSLLFVGWIKQPFNSFTVEHIESALRNFPDDLSIEVVDGTLSTNYDYPYFFWANDIEQPYLLAVISETSTPDEIAEFEAPLLFTGTHLVIADNKSGQEGQVISYGNLNLSVDKHKINGLLSGFEKVRPFISVILLLVTIVIAPLAAIVGTLIYMLVIATFCYFVFGLFSKKHNFQQTLQVSLHAATLPFLTKYGLLSFGYNLDRAWPVFALLVVVFVLSALYETYLDR